MGPLNTVEYTIVSLAEGVWSIEMGMVRAFVVAGSTSAILIDTGAGGVNLRQAVMSLTNLPIRIVNTHAHFDHISGNASFEMRFAHPMELTLLEKAGFAAQPVYDGSGFDLGDRILQILNLPGHSPGSIALWDAEAGLLFAGDVVSKQRPVILSLEGASLEAYIRSLARILSLPDDENGGKLTRIFCSHGDVEADIATVKALHTLAEGYSNGDIEKVPLPEKYASYMSDTAGYVAQGDLSLIVN